MAIFLLSPMVRRFPAGGSLRSLLYLLLLSVAWMISTAPAGAQTMTLRVGTLVPKNSLYHQQLLEIGERWKTAQGGSARFTVYTDGSQGGETDMVRRMRIGQLSGALISVVGLREIEPSIAALQSLPLAFRNWQEVDYVREKMRASMERKFLDKGFVVIAWGDAGWVRFFSKTPAVRPEDFKKLKMFAWAGESEQQEIMKGLGYNPVPLETADILPSIQTGMITAVPSTPYFALASQIYASAPNMLELNWAPIVGAMVVTRKAWDDMSPGARDAMRAAGEQASPLLRQKARQEVDDAVAAMIKRGLKVHTLTPEQAREWEALAQSLYPKIRGTMVPADVFDEVFMHLKTYREGRGKS